MVEVGLIGGLQGRVGQPTQRGRLRAKEDKRTCLTYYPDESYEICQSRGGQPAIL